MNIKHIKLILGVVFLLSGIFSVKAQVPTPGGINTLLGGYELNLWVDGNNSGVGAPYYPSIPYWGPTVPLTPLSPNKYIGPEASTPAPIIRNSTNFNFHKEIYFGNNTASKLFSSVRDSVYLNYSYIVIIVSDAQMTGTSRPLTTLFSFNAGAGTGALTTTSMRWSHSTGTSFLSSFWATTARDPQLLAANYKQYGLVSENSMYGISSMVVQNVGGTGTPGTLNMYLNGVKGTSVAVNQASIGSANSFWVFGNGDGRNGASYSSSPFNGSMVEMIVLRRPSTALSTTHDLDMQKIHSYLAIKYGITLGVNYVNTGGQTVWPYNASIGNVFGLANDSSTGLNQKQARSKNDSTLTVFVGPDLLPLNSSVGDDRALPNKKYVMFGSNGGTFGAEYNANSSTTFNLGSLTEAINFRTNLMYLTHITNDGVAGGNQTLNMLVNYPNAKYVLVSPNNTFTPATTRVYAITSTNRIAYNVLVNHGEYIAFAGYQPAPGGISLAAGGLQVDVWIDGNNSSNTSWPNVIPTNYSLAAISSTTPTPTVRNSELNFHKELFFGNATSSKLGTTANYPLAPGNSYYVFAAYDASTASAAGVLTTFNTATDVSLAMPAWTATAVMLQPYWSTTARPTTGITAETEDARFGLASFGVVNSNSTSTNFIAHNGRSVTFSLAAGANSTGARTLSTSKFIVGNGSQAAGTTSSVPYNGAIQELIVLRGPNSIMTPLNISKINSYLAIKYGITLYTGDYLCSGDNAVWSRTANPGYDKVIFGIGRDDAAKLNQVQSKSSKNDIITVYKAATLATLNDNKSTLLEDKTFLMLGSNGLNFGKAYTYPAGTPFGVGSNPDKLNFRSNLVYRAQITTAGVAGGSQTVNLKINYKNAACLLVSSNPDFPIATTRCYPINNNIVNNVLINNGDYISFAGYEASPGGVKLAASGFLLDLWVDGNTSTNTAWPNLAYSNFTLSKIGSYTPKIQNSKYNYHQEMFFGNSTQTKLGTSTNYNLAANNSYYVFVVSDATQQTTTGTLLAFNSATATDVLRWSAFSATTQPLIANWNTTARNAGPVGGRAARFGIATLNIQNSASTSNNQLHLNGDLTTFNLGTNTAQGPGSFTGKLVVGSNSHTATGTTNDFRGTIQEIIVMRKAGSSLMNYNDIGQIHTYLALKYGISITGNYLNSNGDVIWDKGPQSPYNYHIFGLGRDDESGLYQKQAQSSSGRTPTFFIGNKLATLNSENNGTLEDKQYLLIGSNGLRAISSSDNYKIGDVFKDGKTIENESGEEFNIHSEAIYKAQLVEMNSITVNIQAASNDFLYVLVAPTDQFVKSDTYIYPIKDRIATGVVINETYKYIKFIGFSPGPGGVSSKLALWLRADDDASIDVEYLQGNKVGGDPRLASFNGTQPLDSVLPAVMSWTDFVRNQTYSMSVGGTADSRRVPILRNSAPEMNYHPAVQFWGLSNTYGSYLANDNTNIFGGKSAPEGNKHTAIFLVNGDFNRGNDWIYPMAFGTNSVAGSGGTIPRPGYGVQKQTTGSGQNAVTNMVGRFRSSAAQLQGSYNLFNVGATAMMLYKTDVVVPTYGLPNNSNNPRVAWFRFNGVEDHSNTISTGDEFYSWDNINFATASTLGSGYQLNRTVIGYMSEAIIYEDVLNESDLRKVESYMALKYGITLHPSNTMTNRFHYQFSDGKTIWDGEQTSGLYVNYYNNVAAIIRDDAARLHNSHSHSTDAGTILHVGLAGTALSDDGSEVGEGLNDKEAIVFGHNGVSGITQITNADKCGDFTNRFNRVWTVHKVLQGKNRTMELLIGAQDNSLRSIGGTNEYDNEYYGELGPNNDVWMIVAESPNHFVQEDYIAVVQMQYLNGEHQCSYAFSDSTTFITFGFKPNTSGCAPDADSEMFTGTKTFNWSRWTSNSNRAASSNTGLTIVPYNDNQFVDLGDGYQVIEQKVVYGAGVRAVRGYPRVSNSPERNSLYIRRSRGLGTPVEVYVKFNHPVIPQFKIAALDGYGRTVWEEVKVEGICEARSFGPTLSYETDMKRSQYRIRGNTAEVVKSGSLSASNKAGWVNVKFNGGCTTIKISFTVKGTPTNTSVRNIYISPMTIRAVPPPPPINEDGLSFVKQVNKRELTTCEPVEFELEIQNVKCDERPVVITDTLDFNMKWNVKAIGMDEQSALINDTINYEIVPGNEEHGEILIIRDFMLQKAGTAVLRLGAEMDEDAPTREYKNRARIDYDRIVNSDTIRVNLLSLDKETLDPYTTFFVEWRQRMDPITMLAKADKTTYKEDETIKVRFEIDNSNGDILDDVFGIIDFPEGFTYVKDSFKAEQEEGTAVNPVPLIVLDEEIPNSFIITGTTDDTDGFNLVPGKLVITFSLKAPNVDNLPKVYDDDGNIVPDAVDNLDITFDFASSSDNPCAAYAMKDLNGLLRIPYSKGVRWVISNIHSTSTGKERGFNNGY